MGNQQLTPSQFDTWANNIHHEMAFWRHWFSDEKFAAGRESRYHQLRHEAYPPDLASELGVSPGVPLRVLDIGSGPISTQRMRARPYPVELICVDALADIYNLLLDEFGYADCPRIHKIRGEELTRFFARDSFHLVNIANALDHCEDPAQTVAEMFEVCRAGGRLEILSVENEGEREGYNGLHQWNLQADDAGLWLWNLGMRINLLDGLGGRFEYEWGYEDHGQQDLRIFKVLVQKVSSARRRAVRPSRQEAA